MKKILLALFIAAGIGTATSSDINAQSSMGPKISFEKDVVDYGKIEQGSPKERFWTFKNVGKEPLIIKNAEGSCGCTVPIYPKEPIMPGKTATIKIEYDTQRIGQIAKTVKITTNEPDGSNTHTIRVNGEVTAKQ
jgi:hypothetical protein